MATIQKPPDRLTARVSTNFTYKKVQAIPEFGLPKLHRQHSAGSKSATSTSSVSSARDEGQQISLTEPCFITKRSGRGLKKFHWISAVRGDKPRKVEVETFLEGLHVVPLEFNLNSASNLTPLDPTMHYFLDHLGFVAITCAKPTLQAMIRIVEAENRTVDERWQRLTRQRYVRNFNLSDAPFSTATYEMVVLHPDHFLPLGTGILAYEPGPNAAPNVVAKVYMVAPDGALRESGQGPRFQAFLPPPRSYSTRPTLHPKDNRINPFLVVLNADMAFRRFMRIKPNPPALNAEYQDLVDLTIQLADLIYHKNIVEAAVKGSKDRRKEQEEIDKMKKTEKEKEDQEDKEDDNAMQVDEFGFNVGGGGGDGSKTPRAGGRGRRHRNVVERSLRFEGEVDRAAPDAPDKDLRDHLSSLMPARGDKDSQKALAKLGLLEKDERVKIIASGGDGSEDEDEDEDEEEYEDEDEDEDDDEDEAEDGKVVVGHGDPVPYHQKVQEWQASAIAV